MAEQDKKLGDYLILEKIAHGGMAEIYKAKTQDLGGIERLVVIKRILPHISSHPEYIEMLVDEAKIAVHFTHGNIAQVYDLGKVGDDYFIVMEYVDGKTLGQILREMKFRGEAIPVDIIAYCIMELCQGLDYIHRKKTPDGKMLQVIHRDISPQNIIVSYSGNVKLIDFGVAKALDKLGQTESGVLKGKFAYMSPEQASGKEMDHRSDIFSTGVLLWELLTQQRLFKRKTNPDTIKAVRKAHFDLPSKYRDDIPKELDEIVKKALSKRRSKRYQTASEMAADLRRFLVRTNANFRHLNVAQYLLKYFGPEPDEADLPPEMPQLDIPQIPRPEKPVEKSIQKKSLENEKTEVDRIKNWVRDFIFTKKIAKIAAASFLLMISIWGLIFLIGLFDRAQLTIHVIPYGADLSINGEYQAEKKRFYQITQKPNVPIVLKATMQGYRPYEFTVVLQKDEEKEVEIFLEKRVPLYGDLLIKTIPEGATVYLDDMEWALKTPVNIPRLNTQKKYRIGLFMEGYDFAEKEVMIEGGKTQKIELTLIKKPEKSPVESTPLDPL